MNGSESNDEFPRVIDYNRHKEPMINYDEMDVIPMDLLMINDNKFNDKWAESTFKNKPGDTSSKPKKWSR